jgi:hypothetical protein
MNSSLLSFMQDVAQGVFGKAELTYLEVNNFLIVATPKEKRTVMLFRAKWLDMDEDDVCTDDMITFVKKIIDKNLVDTK